MSDLENLVKAYSKLVVEGKDVSESLGEIDSTINEISDNIPKYTMDKSLAQKSLEAVANVKNVFEDMEFFKLKAKSN